MFSRRDFLAGMALMVGAPAISLMAASRPVALPLAFSTLGCPAWDWKTILDNAKRMGFVAIELRGIQNEIDLTRCTQFQKGQMRTSLSDLRALDLKVSDLGASTKLHDVEPAKRKEQLDEARRYIDLAHELKVPYVRVFGDKVPNGQTKQDTARRITDGLRELGEYSQESGVTVILESHGDFTDSPTLLEILKDTGSVSVALLWDAHHTFVEGNESPARTYGQLKRFIRHTHLKDSRPAGTGKGVQYVLPGEGTVPMEDAVKTLIEGGYRGYYCFEWEKRWHPEIEEPEIAFPRFVEVMKRYAAAVAPK
jgi:sugar phosphate isomerase/epimerase